jgi:crotonobetainyl-CoA:carnitine CoA-transferase CaiB-like acyl-CoA transferase
VVSAATAWGWSGPWAERRGFDSLVQAGVGIAAIEATADGRPGVLPAQALDHGTGYLLAAAVLRALSDRHTTGGGRHLRLSLAGTASWLLHDIHPTPVRGEADLHDPGSWLTETQSPYGLLRHALPPVHYEGVPANRNRGPTRWGTDLPNWA